MQVGTIGNAQEGPGPISVGPISKSINANQLLTLGFYPCYCTLLPGQPPAKATARYFQCSRWPTFLQSSPDHEDLRVRAVEC